MHSGRGRWQGMLAIARFNWPFYASAILAVCVSLAGLIAGPVWLKVFSGMALAGALYFLIGSLGVSHLIYDRSDLYRFGWLERLGILPCGHAVVCHSGFDEVSSALVAALPSLRWTVLDHFDETRMTEASIRRARRLLPPLPGTVPAPFDRWALEDASCDIVFGVLAIHELRTVEERAAWFAEARRCLRPGGRVILAEHLRDLPNFLAFGPGFLHFHSARNWRSAWERARFRPVNAFRITPWISIFELE